MEEMVYEIKVNLKEEDFQDGRMTFYAIFSYFQKLATEHAELLGLGYQPTLDKGLYWVLVKNRCDILSMPKPGQMVRMVSWPLENPRVDCGREFAFYDEQGNVLIRGISRWALIDIHTFRLFPAKKMSFPGSYKKSEYPMAQPFDLIPYLPIEDLGECEILPEDIDGNHHTNNTKYVLFAEKKDECMKECSRFQIDFVNQSFLHDVLSISRGDHAVYGSIGEKIVFKVSYGDSDIF